MRKMPKVISQARFATTESSGSLNINSVSQSILIGHKSQDSLISGFVGKAAERSTGHSILDYGIWLDLAFPHVIGVFGARGSGKSFTLGALLECLTGLGEVVDGKVPSAAVVILDVQNQFWTLSLAPNEGLPEDRQHLEDLRRWKLSPAAAEKVVFWTPCQPDEHLSDAKVFRISPSDLREDDWLAVLELERYSPMGQALVELLQNSNECDPAALAEMARPSILQSFQSSTVDSLRWRLEAIAKMGLIGKPGVDVGDLLQPGRINVMLLRNLPDNMRALTSGVLSRILATCMINHHQALKVAKRRGIKIPDSGLPKRLWLALDEAHVIVPGEGRTPASEPLIDYVKRGRDSGLSMVFATQQPSAVDNKLMSQADITFTHKLGFEADIQAAIKRMPADSSHLYKQEGRPISSLGGVIRALTPGEALVADSESGRIFVQRTRPRLTAHGGNTPQDEEVGSC